MNSRPMEDDMMYSSGDFTTRTIQGRRRPGSSCRQSTGRGIQGTRSHPTQKRVREAEEEDRKIHKKTILSWLIDCEIINEGEQVCYNNGTISITGKITRGGIHCSCCQEETSVWTFEKHAGSDLRQPYEHICVRQTKSLRKCQKDAWKFTRGDACRRKFTYVPKETAEDKKDAACPVCGDGGDLICCDQCPSTYHLSCLNIEMVPENDWFCPYCVCKYCGLVVLKKGGFKCSQCDKKCHWECFEEFSKEPVDLKPLRSYCGPGCREIYKKLDVSLGIRNDYSEKYFWRVIRRPDKTTKKVFADRNIYSSENNSSVAVTWMLMDEAFMTSTDSLTGINMIKSIVYSRRSNLTRVDFRRFYMFVLEKEDEIIAAASIRFHGGGIAEMPFMATDMSFRGQGVCRKLMRIIESFLRDLKVTKLIIPSMPTTSDMWKHKFNFAEVSEELMREISSYKILMFPGCLRLCKDLSESIADGGDGIEDNQTDIKNDLELQTAQAEATARLDMDPHQSPGRLVEAKESQVDTHCG